MGDTLIKTVVDLTGLPADPVTDEINRLIQKASLEKKNLTLDDLREILAEYLQDTLLAAKDTYQGQI